jgi:integrase
MAAIEVLSSRKLESIEKAAKGKAYPVRKEIPDGGLPGLYLVVQPSGAMSWAVRYRFDGRPKKLTIGSYPAFGLADARKAASAALRTVSEGRDPVEEKKLAKTDRASDHDHVDKVLDDFLTRHVDVKNKASSAKENRRLIDVELRPIWTGRKIQSITRRDIIKLLDDIADRGAAITANRVLALVRKFFNWAIERDIIQASPVANVKAPSVEISRDRVLTHDEIRLVWKASERIGWPFGPMVRILLLTGQRRDEVAGAARSEFHLSAKEPLWVIPKERAKNGVEQPVPLAPSVVDLVKGLPVIEGKEGKAKLLLTTTGETPVSGFSKAKESLDAEMLKVAQEEAVERGDDPEGVSVAPWRLHDLRRTCASGMASIGQPVHVVEAVLNHKSGTIRGVSAVYNRYSYQEEKRRALCAWASLVGDIVHGADGDKVVQIRSAGQ